MSRIIPELRYLDYSRWLRMVKITQKLGDKKGESWYIGSLTIIINGLDGIFHADFFIMENEHGKTRGHP